MIAWQATVQDDSGNAIPLPTVTVYGSDGVTLASIFTEAGVAMSNPFTGSIEGFVRFYAESGNYKVEGGGAGGTTQTWDVSLVSNPITDSNLALKNVGSPIFGFDNGVVNTEIFTGANRASQGLTLGTYSGERKLFFMSRVAGSSNKTTERQRISWMPYTGTSTPSAIEGFTNSLNIGHQGIGVFYTSMGAIRFVTPMPTEVGHEDTDAGKGIGVVAFNGASTVQGDVTKYQLFGYDGSGHRFERFYGATPTVSTDGRWLIVAAHDKTASNVDDIEDSMNYVFVYRLSDVLGAADPLTVDPVYKFDAPPPLRGERAHYLQGVASDGQYVYLQRGYVWPRGNHFVQVFSMTGSRISEFPVDDARSSYTVDQLLSHTTLGIPASFEPEGLAIDGNSLLWLAMDDWRAAGSVVSFEGSNYACYADTNEYSPRDERYWVPTDLPASGAWVSGVSYAPGAYTQKNKTVWRIAQRDNSIGEKPLTSGTALNSSGASYPVRSSAVDISWRPGDLLSGTVYSEVTGKYSNVFQFTESELRLFDGAVGADQTKSMQIGPVFTEGREIGQFRGMSSLANSAGFNAYGINDPERPHQLWLTAGGEWVTWFDGVSGSFLVPTDTYLSAISTSVTGPVDPQRGASFTWYEGVQDIQVGEGVSIDWRAKLIGDTTPETIAKIETRKTLAVDTGGDGRLSSLNVQLSSTGDEAGLRDVLSIEPVSGRVSVPFGVVGLPVTLYSVAGNTSHTGTTANTVITTVSVPAGSLGPNGYIDIDFDVTTSSVNTNNKIVTVTYGGVTVHQTAADTLDSTRNYRQSLRIKNTGSESSQYFRAVGAASPYGTSTSTGATTASIDTAASQNITFAFQLENAGDSVSLRELTVKAVFLP